MSLPDGFSRMLREEQDRAARQIAESRRLLGIRLSRASIICEITTRMRHAALLGRPVETEE